MTHTWDLLVLGGGTAGLVGAYTAAALGARVALVERHRTGGDCLWTGCVPSKALQAAAARVAAVRRPPSYVTSGSARVDFSGVMDEVRAAIAAIEPVDSADALTEAGVTVLTGNAAFVEQQGAVVDGERHSFHHALLATGAAPALPSTPGLAGLDLLTSETVWDLEARPDRLLVIGGGPTGCELAQAFARLGSEVTLVEKGDRLLRHVDPDASAAVRRALVADGVRVLTHSVVVDADAGSGRVRVAGAQPPASSPASSRELTVDRVLAVVGRRSRTAGIGLDRAAVSLTPQGAVAVDATLRTSNPRIWAAGDVTPYPHQTHLAAAHASLAVTNALLGTRRRADRLLVPRVVFTDPEVAQVGAATWAETADRLPRTITRSHDHVDRAVTDARTDGFSRLALDRRGRAIVGATLVSPRAGESVTALTLAIERRMSPAALAATVHAYPTYNDGPWNAAVDEIRRRLSHPGARRALGTFLAGRRAQWRHEPRRRSERARRLAPVQSLAILAALLALVATACTTGSDTATSDRASPSGALTAASLVAGHSGTVQGPGFDATSLDRRPVVLWFWSPSCTICRAEGPEVATVAAELAASESAVVLVGVAGRGDRAEMADFVEATGTGDLTHLVDADGTIWSRLGVIGQPAFAFVSADGEVDLFAGSLGESALRTRALALEAGVS